MQRTSAGTSHDDPLSVHPAVSPGFYPGPVDRRKCAVFLVPGERIELPTNGLQNRCSTAELTRPVRRFNVSGRELPSDCPAACWGRYRTLRLPGCDRAARRAVARGAGMRGDGCGAAGTMTGPTLSLWRAPAFGLALAMSLVAAAPSGLRAQSADLVLCDRLAGDPADPEKPAGVKGAAEIAPGDIATAVKFCRTCSKPAGAARAGRGPLAASMCNKFAALFRSRGYAPQTMFAVAASARMRAPALIDAVYCAASDPERMPSMLDGRKRCRTISPD